MDIQNKTVRYIYIGGKQVERITMLGSIVYQLGHTLSISGPASYTGTSVQLVALYDNAQAPAVWVITSGDTYATINSNGKIDIEAGTIGASVTVAAFYGGCTAFHNITLTYDNQLTIECADTITGISGNAIAKYNSNVVTPTWSITSGNAYATIDSAGEITIISSGNITLSATYNGYTATKEVALVYASNTSTETTVDPETGATTTTTTTTETDPQTGEVTESTTTTTTNEDGSTTQTTETTVTQTDGSSETQTTTQNSDGTSTETTTTTSAPDPETGSVTTETETTNYDENGDPSGSQTSTTVENTDGSSSTTTTNYNSEGDPTTTETLETDTDGNESVQNITYDENGNPVVSGYDIDTSNNPDGEKTFDGDGVNTEFYGFDSVDGFVMRMHFTIDFTDQPANQDENHHQILCMKRATPSPWYGFQLRQSSTNKYIQLGTQFEFGSNTNTRLNPTSWIVENQIAEYDIQVVYDPTAFNNTFVATNMLNGNTIFTSDYLFPDLPELRYLTVCIGYALDENGDPYRYSNINVLDFSISKIQRTLADPLISCDGRHTLHYILNKVLQSPSFVNMTMVLKNRLLIVMVNPSPLLAILQVWIYIIASEPPEAGYYMILL